MMVYTPDTLDILRTLNAPIKYNRMELRTLEVEKVNIINSYLYLLFILIILDLECKIHLDADKTRQTPTLTKSRQMSANVGRCRKCRQMSADVGVFCGGGTLK